MCVVLYIGLYEPLFKKYNAVLFKYKSQNWFFNGITIAPNVLIAIDGITCHIHVTQVTKYLRTKFNFHI